MDPLAALPVDLRPLPNNNNNKDSKSQAVKISKIKSDKNIESASKYQHCTPSQFDEIKETLLGSTVSVPFTPPTSTSTKDVSSTKEDVSWTRGVIKRFISNQVVVVELVDYGFERWVDFNK